MPVNWKLEADPNDEDRCNLFFEVEETGDILGVNFGSMAANNLAVALFDKAEGNEPATVEGVLS